MTNAHLCCHSTFSRGCRNGSGGYCSLVSDLRRAPQSFALLCDFVPESELELVANGQLFRVTIT